MFARRVGIIQGSEVATYFWLPVSFSLLLKSANIEACQPRCRSTYSYYMKSGIFNGVTYLRSYNRFQLLETLPQRLHNGVCLFNGVTTISKNLTFSYSRLGMVMERPYLQFRHSRSPILCIIDQDGVESIGPGQGWLVFFQNGRPVQNPGVVL
jgi:hypothetical protein